MTMTPTTAANAKSIFWRSVWFFIFGSAALGYF
jgi:hypothetical protein